MTLSIQKLVAVLRPRDEETRILGATPIAVAGVVGYISETLNVVLALSRLSPAAKTAALDLRDAGVIIADVDGHLLLGRLPTNAFERRALREALGLTHQRADV